MQKSQKEVRKFMRLFGQSVPASPTIPQSDIRLLRVSTLAEEIGELAQASGVKLALSANPDEPRPEVHVELVHDGVNLALVADALCDIQYFVDGTANAYGLDLEEFFDAVHEANMHKLWSSCDLQKMESGWSATAVTVTYSNRIPRDKQDSEAPEPVRTMFIVKRPDGKVMKPPGFRSPVLSDIVNAQKCIHNTIDTATESEQPVHK